MDRRETEAALPLDELECDAHRFDGHGGHSVNCPGCRISAMGEHWAFQRGRAEDAAAEAERLKILLLGEQQRNARVLADHHEVWQRAEAAARERDALRAENAAKDAEIERKRALLIEGREIVLADKAENATLREKLAAAEQQLAELLKGGESGMTRWEVGFRNVVTVLIGPHTEFDIPEIVSCVRDLMRRTERLREQLAAAEQRAEEAGGLLRLHMERAIAGIDAALLAIDAEQQGCPKCGGRMFIIRPSSSQWADESVVCRKCSYSVEHDIVSGADDISGFNRLKSMVVSDSEWQRAEQAVAPAEAGAKCPTCDNPLVPSANPFSGWYCIVCGSVKPAPPEQAPAEPVSCECRKALESAEKFLFQVDTREFRLSDHQELQQVQSDVGRALSSPCSSSVLQRHAAEYYEAAQEYILRLRQLAYAGRSEVRERAHEEIDRLDLGSKHESARSTLCALLKEKA
jgi:DNA-directed RNA polymerase subunit M/transcription elongation factor TFIIS